MNSVPNYVDIALMAFLAFFTIRALVRGFVREVLGLLGVVVAVVISAMTFEPLGDLLQAVTGVEGAWWHAVAFVLVLLSIL
jgi:membrane protein required for colicin V production